MSPSPPWDFLPCLLSIDLSDLLPFLGDECQLSMLRRCHCYPRFPSVPGGGHHWGDSNVPCVTHISTEELIQLAFFSMKKFPSKIFLEKFHTKSQFYHGFYPPWEVFLTIYLPWGYIRLTNPCINLKRIKIVLRTKYCHLWLSNFDNMKLSSPYWRREFALESGNVQTKWIQSYFCLSALSTLFALWTCILSILHLWLPLFDIISYHSCTLWQPWLIANSPSHVWSLPVQLMHQKLIIHICTLNSNNLLEVVLVPTNLNGSTNRQVATISIGFVQYVIIPWSKERCFLDGKCKQLNEDTQFV